MRRRLGRFVVLAMAISVLVFFLLFQQGLLSGLVTEFVGALRNQSGQVLVYSDLARDNLQASVVTPTTVDEVAEVDGVADAGPLGVGTFTADIDAGDGGERTDVQLFGYRLGGPGAPTTVSAGRLPEDPDEAVTSANAGAGFAIGDTVRLTGDGPAITIVGTGADLSFSVLPTLFVDLDTYERARLAQNPDAVAVPPSAVAVTLTDGADPAAVADRIDAQVTGVDALTRDQAEERAPGVSEVQRSFDAIIGLGWITVGVVVSFFFLILTTQKLPQITLLRAVGVEAATLVGAVGVQVVAILVAALVLGGLGASGALSGGGSGISASLASSDLVRAAVLLGLAGAIALGVSAWRIARVDPVEAVEGATL